MAKEPTFRLLDCAYLSNAENALLRKNVTAFHSGLKLSESDARQNPLALGSRDGSLGKLGLPPGIALDPRGCLYLLGSGEASIIRYDPCAGKFAPLAGVGGDGTEARRFRNATNIAIAGNNLYVADRGNRRVQVFSLDSFVLLHIWGPWDAADVCSGAGAAYMLDAERGRVYRHTPGTSELRLILESIADDGRWSRLLVDQNGWLYLFDAVKSELSVFTGAGTPAGTVKNAGEVRERFAAPEVVVDALGLYLWGGLTFDKEGHRAKNDPTAPIGPRRYETRGVWISRALNSGIYRCPWHRIELDADLPTGTRVVVSTYTDNRLRSDEDILALDDFAWETRFVAASPSQTEGSGFRSTEFLVQSLEGQYLWLRLELESDGFAPLKVRLLRVHYPRETYLNYLPAIYSSDEEGRRFLEKFLAVFKTEWDSLEGRNSEIAGYFDPKAVPPRFMNWLANWLALSLEQSWTPEQKRRLLKAAPAVYPRMGTPDGLRAYLRVYLENLGGALPENCPVVVEGFRRRRQMLSLTSSPLGREGSGAQLWSRGVVGRLQVGEYSRVGEARIVSTGTPETDVFAAYAHRFQVFIPASAVRTAADERMVRRAVDTVKPAHTSYELVLFAPRFRIGMQSSVGLNTMIGAYPVTRLAGGGNEEESPNAPPQSRLGYDTVLARLETDQTAFRLTPSGARAGLNTILK